MGGSLHVEWVADFTGIRSVSVEISQNLDAPGAGRRRESLS
jgi:hypothetical protein